MPIIDKVLVNEQDINNPDEVSTPPRVRISDYIEQNIRKNIIQYGDSTCLVSVYVHYLEIMPLVNALHNFLDV